jgi:hypothetical protein
LPCAAILGIKLLFGFLERQKKKERKRKSERKKTLKRKIKEIEGKGKRRIVTEKE